MEVIKKRDKFDLFKEESMGGIEEEEYEITLDDMLFIFYIGVFIICPARFGATMLQLIIYISLAKIYLFIYFFLEYKDLCSRFLLLITLYNTIRICYNIYICIKNDGNCD